MPTFRRSVAAVLLATLLVGGLAGVPPASADPSGELEITGGGWGHGVGMGQYGSKGMADAGSTYRQILQHFYTGVSVAAPATPPAQWDDVRVRLGETDGTVTMGVVGNGASLDMPDGTNLPVADWSTVKVGRSGGQIVVKVNEVVVGTFPEGGAVGLRLRGAAWADVNLGSGPVRTYHRGDIAVVPDPGLTGCTKNSCVIVRRMTMDEYLYGLAEMPSSWHVEALKTQAVAGRSYAGAMIRDRANRAFHLDSTVNDQAYTGWAKESEATYGVRWVAAVNATHDEVIWSGGRIATAYYSSSSGGHTADSGYVFSTQLPYAYGVPDPGDATPANPNHRWVRRYTLDEIGSWLGLSGVYHVELGGNIGTGGRTNWATVWVHHAGGVKEYSAPTFRNALNARAGSSRQIISTKWAVTRAGFTDVAPGAFYAEPVSWAVEHGITTGVGGGTTFEPGRSVTRGELATFLYRMVAPAPPTGGTAFPDVDPSAFYATPVRWLSQEGITGGVGSTGLFQPNRSVTRGEVATFLHRLARQPAVAGPSGFTDVPPGAYYAPGVTWMTQLGITTGVGGGSTFAPNAPVTRGELVTFLYRMANTPAAWSLWSPPPEIVP